MPEATGLTYGDLAAFPDDGLRRELLDGELIVSPSPRTRHQEVVFRLTGAFYNYLSENGVGRAFPAPYDVVLSPHDVVEPDLVFVADDQADIIGEDHVTGAPALLVEVVSDPRIDRVRKRDLYARFGVREYWVVDPDADRVEVYRLQDSGYGKPEILEPQDVLVSGILPGFAIDVAILFAR